MKKRYIVEAQVTEQRSFTVDATSENEAEQLVQDLLADGEREYSGELEEIDIAYVTAHRDDKVSEAEAN